MQAAPLPPHLVKVVADMAIPDKDADIRTILAHIRQKLKRTPSFRMVYADPMDMYYVQLDEELRCREYAEQYDRD